MLRRRASLSLPFPDQLPELVELVAGCPASDRVLRPARPERFLDAVVHHKTMAFAAARVATGRLVLPREVRGQLERGAAVASLRSGLLRRALAEIVPLVADACRAQPVLIKGPGVADRYYPDPGLRPFVDLDLVVPRARVESAVRALRGVGYVELDEFRPGFAQRHGHDVHLRRVVGHDSIDVELHWRIGDDPAAAPLDHARLVAGEAALDVVGLRVPPRELDLLVLSLHLLGDRAKKLIWVNDLRLAAEGASATEWKRSFEAAGELGLGWVLHRGLDYAARHLGLARPRPVPPGAPPPWGPLRAVEELDGHASLHLGRLAGLGWRDRAGYLWTVLVPTRAALRASVGRDGASTWRMVGRHLHRAVAGLAAPGR